MYAMCQDMPNVTAEDYAKVIAELGGAEREAQGLVAHVAGPVEGGFRIVDVWETRQDAERFTRDHLDPAVLRAHGGGDLAAGMRAGFQQLDVTG